jgi:hypothetical protein
MVGLDDLSFLTDSAMVVHDTVESKQLNKLPLNGRDILQSAAGQISNYQHVKDLNIQFLYTHIYTYHCDNHKNEFILTDTMRISNINQVYTW